MRPDLRGQDRGIGCDHIIAVSPLQGQHRHAEGVILVVHLPVAGVEGAFGNAPGQAVRAAPVHLHLHRHHVGMVQDATLPFFQQKRRHQVFEHAARPGQQRPLVADGGKGAPQPCPVFLADVALGDRQEAGQPRFGGQQVIGAFVKLVVQRAIADGQQHLVGLDEQAEVHAEGQHPRALGQQAGAQHEQFDGLAPFGGGGHDTAGVLFQKPRPGQRLGSLSLRRRVQFGGKAHDLGRAGDQLRRGQRVRHGAPAHLVQHVLHSRDRAVERAAQVAQAAPALAQGVQFQPQVGQRVAQSRGAAAADRGRVLGPGPQPRRQRDQQPRQVAAVHRRDIGRRQHGQVAGVVPVEEMAAESGHPLHRRDRGVDPRQGVVQPDPAEVMGRHHRHQVKPDVGGRGALGQLRFRVGLPVVGRQVVRLGADKGFEIAPGAAGDAAQLGLVPGRQEQPVLGFQGPRGAVHDPGRGDPDAAEDQRHGQRGRVQGRGAEDACPSQHGRGDHAPVFGPDISARRTARVAGGGPFQQVPAADRHPPQRPADRVQRGHRPVRGRRKPQAQLGDVGRQVAPHVAQVIVPGDPVAGAEHPHVDLQHRHQRHQQDQRPLPQDGLAAVQRQPAQDRGRDPGGRDQRAAEVVHHLEPREPGQPVPGIEDQRQQLPVAPRPAVLAARLGGVADGEVLDHLDIRDQRGAGKAAFQQVVRQDGVFRQPAFQRALEGIDVIDALAGEAALAREVLVKVRDSEDVRVKSPVGREDALEDRGLGPRRQRRRDARLHDAVAADHNAVLAVDGAVHGMLHLAHQRADRVARQAGVAVQRHDIADALGRGRAGRQEAGALVPAQKLVQFRQLAALALPSHPDAFGWVPLALAVQKKEAPDAAMVIAFRQRVDARARMGQQALVLGQGLGRGVLPVRQQREEDVTQGVRQIVRLQHVGQFVDRVDRGDHAGDDDQRPRLGGDAVAEVIGGQPPRGDDAGGQKGDGLHGRVRGGQHRQRQQQHRLPALHPVGQDIAKKRHQHRGKGHERQGQVPPAGRPGKGGKALERAGAIARPDAEGRPVVAHQQVAHRDAGGLGLAALDGLGARVVDGALGDLGFRQVRAAGDALDLGAVIRARGLVEAVELGRAGQQGIDVADALEPVEPVDLAHPAQAADDVADGHVAAGLARVFGLHGLFGALRAAQAPFQRRQRGLRIRPAVAQAVKKLGGHGVVGDQRGVALDHGGGGAAALGLGQLVGQGVGEGPPLARKDHAVGQAAQVFDQHIAQEGGHGPQFGNVQCRHGLIAAQELAQRVGGDFRIGQRHEIPGDHQRARGRAAARQRRGGQAVQEGGVQRLPQLAQVFLDHVVVVDQPFGGGRDRVAPFLGRDRVQIVAPDGGLVVDQPGDGARRRVGQLGPQDRGQFRPRVLQRAAGPDVQPDRQGDVTPGARQAAAVRSRAPVPQAQGLFKAGGAAAAAATRDPGAFLRHVLSRLIMPASMVRQRGKHNRRGLVPARPRPRGPCRALRNCAIASV